MQKVWILLYEKRVSRRVACLSAAAIALFAIVGPGASTDVALSPAEVVDAFSAAIDRGDRTAALALLTRDVIIFEAGFADRSRSDYEGLHLSLDIRFASSTLRSLRSRRQGSSGELHWVASLYSDQGRFEGRPIDQSTAETVLLRQVGGQWRIAHIHWSSEPPADGPLP